MRRNDLPKESRNVSFRGAEGDEESRSAFAFGARFLAEFTLSVVEGLGMIRLRNLFQRAPETCAFQVLVLWLSVGLAVPASAGAPGPKPTLEQVGNQVYCLCGCVTLLNRCPHLPSECQNRAELQAAILKGIQQGKTDKAILNDLVGLYGVRVLAAPPAAGFNLTAWILPGVALLIGLAVVIVMVRRWRSRVAAASDEEEPAPSDPAIAAAVEEEMRQIESLKD